MSPISIVIIEQRTLFRQGLAAIVRENSDFEFAGDASDADEAWRLCQRVHPDLILIGAEFLKEFSEDAKRTVSGIKAAVPDSFLIVMGCYHDTDDTFSQVNERILSKQFGAAAYISSSVDQHEFISILRQVALHGHPYHSHSHITSMHLTDREKEVIGLLAEGMSNKELAHRLGISIQTVKNHVSHLLEKLALADRTQLALFAHDNHLHH